MQMRWTWLAMFAVACNPAVEPSVGETGGSESGTAGSATSGAETEFPETGAQSTTSSSTTGSPSSSGSTHWTGDGSTSALPQVGEFEGVFHYDPEAFDDPISLQFCDGTWARVDTWSMPDVFSFPQCGGTFIRVLGELRPTGGVYGGDDLVVQEVFDWRPCEPADCGGALECEPPRCIWRCSPFDQDCGPDQRCVPFPIDGGVVSGTQCVPVPDEPTPLGEPCNRDASTFTEDDCDFGAVCLGGLGTREGVCAELCQGADLACSEGVCVVSSGPGAYCLPSCEPADAASCDGVCVPGLSNGAHGCVPEVGLPELLDPCADDGCEQDFACSLDGPTDGLCVPVP